MNTEENEAKLMKFLSHFKLKKRESELRTQVYNRKGQNLNTKLLNSIFAFLLKSLIRKTLQKGILRSETEPLKAVIEHPLGYIQSTV